MTVRNNLIIALAFISKGINAQLTPNSNSGATTTTYTNGASNDPIYIWCAEGLTTNSGSLTATPTSGVAPFTFQWYYHDEVTSSWVSYLTDVGATSTLNNLPSDGYRVEIYDNNGTLTDCFVAWVWNMNTEYTVANSPTACDATGLTATLDVTNFTYYNPPPPESIINASTEITVCFSATHTYVSDLGFFLVGPPSCGSPTIPLSPHPEAINAGNGCCCNSGNNVTNLCFSTTVTNGLFVCTSAAPLTGTYGAYEGNLINWAPLYGCNAAQGGWRVQIYDCIGADVGALTNASISFSNLTSVCGSPTTINYTSGVINSAINDNSCSAATASIFEVPVSNSLSTPIVINPTVNYLWSSSQPTAIPNPSTSLTNAVASIPNGVTQFYFTADVSFGTAFCSYIDSTEFTQTCCTAIADAGVDVAYCNGSSIQIGTPNVAGMTYSWSPSTNLSSSTIAQPTVSASNAGAAPITVNYTLTVTNVVDGGCTATDDVVVTINPTPSVNAGNYTAVCPENGAVALIGSPAGGAFSGTGVTGTNFDPLVGTQTVTYTYTDANSCSNSATAQITVYPAAVINAGTDQEICSGNQVALTGSGGINYVWDNGVTNGQAFTPSVGTVTYTVTGTDANGCVDTDQVIVEVIAQPIADFTSDVTTGVVTFPVTFTNNSVNGDLYTWNFGNGSIQATTDNADVNSSYTEQGVYMVILTATNGICSDQDTLLIIALPKPPPVVHIPNVFTPNNDGDNDLYFFTMENVESLDLLIVNRWGNVMFEGSGINPAWDGKLNSGSEAVEGTYFYKYTLTGINGDVLQGHGFVELLR